MQKALIKTTLQGAVFVLFVMAASFLFLFSCGSSDSQGSGISSGGTNTGNVSEVGNLSAVAGNAAITLNWQDPVSAEFNKVEITCLPDGTTAVEVLKGVQTKLFSGLKNATEYTFTVKTVDARGNKSSGKTVKATPQANAVTLEVTYEQGTITNWKNIYVVWIENETSSFLQNLKICSKLIAGGLTGTALPYWKVNKYPSSANNEVDAVTSATVANADFTVSAVLKDTRIRKFTVYFEVDRYYEPNDWFPIDQPALLYSANVDLDSGVTEYTLLPAGWTPNEITANIIPGTPMGTLQKELRYITNLKSGAAFGAPDSRSSTNMVKKITLRIK